MSEGGILVIKLGALGDVAQALGAFQAIRDHHRGRRVVLLTTPPFATLFKTCPWFDAVWVDPRQPFWRLAWLELRRRLRAARFSRVYDLQTTSRSSWYFTMLAPGPRPEWVGIARGASHRHADPRRDFIHTRQRLAGQLAVAGLTPIDAPDLTWLDADPDRFALPSRFALLVPGASPHRPEKRWPASSFAELAARLAARSIGSVVLGAS
ncbi:MAG: glycosyltransferase family 9 protein, partial [Alphaproteobacteria bacterium]|nr:glycosyltransferase family 9 protein [Alphaproteobacteria bacterium]